MDALAEITQFAGRLSDVMGADRFRLRRELDKLRRMAQDGQAVERGLERWKALRERSAALRARKAAAVPAVKYDPDLPIVTRRDDILAALREHQVVIVCGETGSGKSTQLPKLCLELGRGVERMIGHTQPRRIAARSVATRVAEELGSSVGQAVGFKVRFTDTTQPETFVKVMTDGVLLAETQHDRFLDAYDTLILDEAHERSLNIDFLLGYLHRLLPRRRDLQLIITSATIDAARFAEHFTLDARRPVPVLEVSGRMYPVEVRYRPLVVDDDEPDVPAAIVDAIEDLMANPTASHPPDAPARDEDEPPLDEADPAQGEPTRDAGPRRRGHLGRLEGDILVFLPTEWDILEAAKTLRGHFQRDPVEILPLYARLSAKDQQRVFEPHARRRIVLATNVAESSLTVPGIRYVVDTGTARISRYSPRSKVQRLPIEPVARASADQRAGRCGRLGPGVCVRLYGADDYAGRDRYTTPEIRRANLASVILQTTALRLGNLEEFPFLDPPPAPAIADGYRTLFELGATDEHGELTEIGRQLSRLPVDPRIGRMILAGRDEGCLRETLVLAAVLEIQDPRERPVDKQQAADAAHARFAHEESDFLALLKLWQFYDGLKETLSRNQLRKACQQNFLSHHRMREWIDVYVQLVKLVEEHWDARPGGWLPWDDAARSSDGYARLHRALLTGLLSNVACRLDAHEYTGSGQQKFFVWPGSGTFAKKPTWIVAAELVETTRRYARTVARIDPGWIEPLAGHLLHRSYSDPRWSRKSGSAMANEKVTLFGLTIVPRRPVRYGPIDPAASRELLIRGGLVEGEFDTRAPFFEHNRRLIAEIEALGAKARRADLLIDETSRFRFYDQRLPADAYDMPRFEKWRKQAEREQPRLLFMSRDDLLGSVDPVAPESFPDELAIPLGRPAGPASPPPEMRLKLEYRFEPGAADDGLTLVVPRAGLGQLGTERIGWLVPGLLEERVLGLIRSLPKSLRRNLVPAPDTARRAVNELRFGHGSFLASVADVLSRLGGERIPVEAFRPEELPPHLQLNVRVVDDAGEPVAAGRDLEQLRQELGITGPRGDEPAAAFADPRWHRDGITAWDFGDLPEQIVLPRGGTNVPAFPGLVDERDSVSLRLFDSPDVATASTRGGLRRLFALAERRSLRAQVDWLPDLDRLALLASTLCPLGELKQQLADLIADRGFLADRPFPRSADDFAVRLRAGRERCLVAVQDVTRVIGPLLRSYHEVKLLEESLPRTRFAVALDDIASQLAALLPAHFLTATPWPWLQQVPRFLQGIKHRLEKLSQGGLVRDQQALSAVAPLWSAFRTRAAQEPTDRPLPEELTTYRWMLEEYRVSLFAQHLGTSQPISPQRLEKQWAKVK